MSLVLTHAHRHRSYPLIAVVGMAVYCACITVMAINYASVTSSVYMICLAYAALIAMFMPLGVLCNCIFMTIPFTSVLKLPVEAFSFITLIQLLLIVRTILSRVRIKVGVMVIISLICVYTQLVPMLSAGQTISNIILLIFNVLTFYCVYKLAYSERIIVPHAFICFAIGTLVAGIVAQNYEINIFVDQGYRFAGLWTDPNFWGMFCLIGIVSCLMTAFRRPVSFVVLLPIILGLAFQGFMTLSRTFIFVCVLMVLVISWTSVRKNVWVAFLIICVLAVGIIYALPYAEEVFARRHLNENDISNGRFVSTIEFIEYIFNHLEILLFGMGYTNVLNYNDIHNISAHATHNTYADFLVEFGLVTDILFIIGFCKSSKYIKAIYKSIRTMPGLVLCILLFYMGTLSMLKYALVYLFFGTILGYSVKLCEKSKQLC